MASFAQFGSVPPRSPVVLSVPHGGRDYPATLRSLSAIPFARLETLEDRHVDTLAQAAWAGEAMIVARRPRAWIDLNRSPLERDPRVEDGAPLPPRGADDKVRSGLGIVPRRAGGADMAWRRRLSVAEVAERIAVDHEPYHAALAAMLESARRRFGIAVLLDIHSMPPLGGEDAPGIVVGDRFGRSCAPRFTQCVEDTVLATGASTAINRPYAGGYILERHGRPARGVHALQFEIDRRLYLDERLSMPGAGMQRTADLIRAVIEALAETACATTRHAAE